MRDTGETSPSEFGVGETNANSPNFQKPLRIHQNTPFQATNSFFRVRA